jgi:tyrosine-protein phosphatase SIW14
MVRSVRFILGMFITLTLIGGPIGYAHFRQAYSRNFRVVREDVLYRSGQMSIAGLKCAIHDHGIKTVVTLRDSLYSDNPPPDLEEEEYCKAQGINYRRISPRTWWAPVAPIPAEEGVRIFRDVMDNPANFPVLIHCYAGIHRTGAFCAVYRMEYEQWSNAEAIAELRANGYKDLDDEWDLLGYLEQYQPRSQRHGAEQDNMR